MAYGGEDGTGGECRASMEKLTASDGERHVRLDRWKGAKFGFLADLQNRGQANNEK
jgi:hypothetical protein